MALNGLSVLLFVPPAPEVLAEIKRTIGIAFCSLVLRLELSLNALKIRSTMTWLSHYIILQIRKGNELMVILILSNRLFTGKMMDVMVLSFHVFLTTFSYYVTLILLSFARWCMHVVALLK